MRLGLQLSLCHRAVAMTTSLPTHIERRRTGLNVHSPDLVGFLNSSRLSNGPRNAIQESTARVDQHYKDEATTPR